MNIKKIKTNILKMAKVAANEYADKEKRGYVEAAWLNEQKPEIIEFKDCLNEKLEKATTLGYDENDVKIRMYLSTHDQWSNWFAFELKIDTFGFLVNQRIVFPYRSTLPKEFLVPLLEKEKIEQNKIKDALKKRQAEETAKAEAEKKAAEEKAQRKTAQIVKWVKNHGTRSQKDRLKENLLPETEIIDAIRSETYAPLDEWPRYKKLTASDVCDCEYEYCDVDFDVADKELATKEEFSQFQEIKKLMPKAIVELREHTGESKNCKNTIHRTGFMVRMTVGEFEFSREKGRRLK